MDSWEEYLTVAVKSRLIDNINPVLVATLPSDRYLQYYLPNIDPLVADYSAIMPCSYHSIG